jgi:hypothetical protein
MTFKEFETNLTKSLKPHIIWLTQGEEGAKLSDVLGKLIFRGKGPTRANLPRTITDIYRAAILSGFNEISESYYTLRDISVVQNNSPLS